MGISNQLISVHPEDLRFQYELEKQSCCDLKIVNNTEHHVAFKVKTTTPKKYFVRPNTGVIQALDSCVITVTLQAQREYPPDMQCKDKFLLQSTIIPPNIDVDEIPQDAFNKDGERKIEECKLRVVYSYPGRENAEDEASFMKGSKQSPDAESVREVQRLKEERHAVLQQTKLLQHELDRLKRLSRRKSDPGFSFSFVLFVGLIGAMVGFILNLALSAPPTE
ncbi:vesicle-associated protein 2-1-like [Macadamia integrifolia]|uniref:vesicle-associated protein 2-1-like n=1 Tax=Macadamia integrifolia TaxID=60698 RepID=UPI001C4FCFB8|nr:vesicle-associated protein 2-1-like [Macadamia integrifolia]XP_042504399.1 vesicle-associated protein 2-1-like [Macadamia integrifolia]